MTATTAIKTKADQAYEIVKAGAGKMTRKQMISKIMNDLSMTEAGASTYHYNAMKKLKAEGVDASIKNVDKPATNEADASAKGKKAPKAKAKSKAEPASEQQTKEVEETVGSLEGMKDQIDTLINEIDGSEVPEFLKKGWFGEK